MAYETCYIPNRRTNHHLFHQHLHKMKRILAFSALVLSTTLTACSQGYKIDVKIDGLKDTTIILGYHFGEKKFVSDSAFVDSKGVAVFQGDSLLSGGMYLIILPQHTYFDFLLSDNQQFSITTSAENLTNDLKFQHSKENSAFADYQRFMSDKQQKMAELRKQLQAVAKNTDEEQKVIDQMNLLDTEVKNYWDRVINENPGTFFANIIRTLKPIEFPTFDIPENAGNPDSLKWVMSYRYNQQHYFDNIALTDDRLIRTPFLQNRIDNYFDRVLLPIPDTIKLYADKVIEKTRPNDKMFQFMVSHLLSKYQNHSIMGMDGVFVHLAEKYYLSGDATWLSSELLTQIANRVNELKPNLIGEIAPNFRMMDINGKMRELHDVKGKLIVLYFWEPGCSHCKKVTPQLKDIYSRYKQIGLEVVAVYTQTEMDKWKEYVATNELNWINVWDPNRITNYHKFYDIYSTPTLYILDANKKIIGKRIGIESLEKFIQEELY